MCLAWGVSPRYGEINQKMSPWRGRQIIRLGREPQERGEPTMIQPPKGVADD